MAMTAAQQKDAYQFFIIAFGAAPGTVYMDQLNDAYASGMTTQEIVNVYTTKPQFTALYPKFLSDNAFAVSLVNNVVKGSATDAAKAEAVADIQAALASGMTRGDVIYQVFTNLANKPLADATWGNTAKLFANEVAVAKYYTETLLGSSTDVAALQAVVSGVTASSDVSSNAAISTLFDAGKTFTLTTGQDNIVGTSGNDIINALTIDATGASKSTLSPFDAIDGGAGNDTLNIFTATGLNDGAFPANATVKNVETINFNNAGEGVAVDASKFVGATVINQVGAAAAVTELASTTTAGFKDLTATALSVTAADAATSATVALSAAKGVTDTNVAELSVKGAALNSVVVSGNIAQTTAGAVAASLALEVTAGKDVETLSVNSAVKTTLSVTDGAGTKPVSTVDASASTGDITYAAATDKVATIKTGAGADTVELITATSNTVNALVETGAGNDTITVNTTGVGTTTVDAGAGNDTITVTTNSAGMTSVDAGAGNNTITVNTTGTGKTTVDAGAGNDKVFVNTTGTGNTTVNTGAGDDAVNVTARGTGILTVSLGDGADSFTTASTVAINGTDVIDAGAGTDTLLLSLVGSANVGAFRNFEILDAVDLNHALDAELLNANNTVTEFISSGSVFGTAGLINVGANVGVRVTGDMFGTNAAYLSVTQKAAGALTVTLDADSTVATANPANLYVQATNATSLKAVFATDSAFTLGANKETISLIGDKATSLEVVSGGTNATNVLNYTAGLNGGNGSLTSMTITGTQHLDITGLTTAVTTGNLPVQGVSQLATIDASALTGGLTADLADLKDGGTIKLGSGHDVISNFALSTSVAFEKIAGFEKALAVAVSTVAGDAKAAAAAVADTDWLALVTGSSVSTGTGVAKGVLTFTGAGPSTLVEAIGFANTAAATNSALVFEYVGNSYVFVQGDAMDSTVADTMVQLVGVTGVTNFAEAGTTDNFFIV